MLIYHQHSSSFDIQDQKKLETVTNGRRDISKNFKQKCPYARKNVHIMCVDQQTYNDIFYKTLKTHNIWKKIDIKKNTKYEMFQSLFL